MCLLKLSLLLFILSTYSNALQDVVFLVPFEISFSDTNQFGFTINYLPNFIEDSSIFFNVQKDNITIAFIKDISSTNYIDVGFTVSANIFNEQNTIKNIDIHSYRSYLMNTNNLPHIIGIESKYQTCTNGKYSTFYHYNIECQWLCNHLSIYDNHTNECHSISNISSTIQITETDTSKFIFIGYGSSVLITTIFCIIFALNIYIKSNPKFVQRMIKMNRNKNKSTKPGLKKKKSVYFYNDTENENDEQSNEENEEINKEINTDNKILNTDIEPFPENDNENNITLSVKTSRSNSIKKENIALSAFQSPTTQNDAIFRETTLAPLEKIECDETLKKMKSIIIEEARLEQFKLMDSLDEFRQNVTNEIDKQQIEQKQKLQSEYLKTVKNITEKNDNQMNETEKKTELDNIEIQYNETKNKLEKQEYNERKNKINNYKHSIKQQMLNIKNSTKQKLNTLIQDDQNKQK